MEEVNELTWLTKAEAIAHTKISLRTIEREITAGNIRTKQRRQVGRRSITVLHPQDVERLHKDFTPISAAEADTGGEDQSGQLPAIKGQGLSLAALLENLRPFVKEQRRFLTVEQASSYTGLPPGYLWKKIRDNTLTPIHHGKYYLRVSDLDKL